MEERREDFVMFDTYDDFKRYVTEHEKDTMNHYITMKQEKSFSSSDWKGKCLHWYDHVEDLSSTPFVNIGQLLLGCHQGRDKNIGKKAKYRQQVAKKVKNGNVKRQNRVMTQATKKLDCPAMINVKKVAMFPELKEHLKCSPWKKRKVVLAFQQKVKNDRPIKVVYKYMARFPQANAHMYHIQGEFAGMREPVDPLIRQKITQLVQDGVTKVTDIQKVVRQYVTMDLFAGQAPPSAIRRRYHPTPRDIMNMSYTVRNRPPGRGVEKKEGTEEMETGFEEKEEGTEEMETGFEEKEEGMEEKEGRTEEERDSKQEESDEDDDAVIMDDFVSDDQRQKPCCGDEYSVYVNPGRVSFCYQSRAQQRLLARYGSMVVIDVAFRSSDIPASVVFLYVRTNVDFQLVGLIVIEEGRVEFLREGLSKIKAWNPAWQPEFVVMDHERELRTMVQELFLGVHIFVSDFHREQVWRVWFSENESDVEQQQKERILEIVHRMVHSTTRGKYEAARRKLHTCLVWKASSKLQEWFATTWDNELSRPLWLLGIQPDKLCVLLMAMGGLARLNGLLKTNFFEGFSITTVQDLINICQNKIAPGFFQRYVESNIRCSSWYGRHNKALPIYLKDRPKDLVCHVKSRFPVPAVLIDSVVRLGAGAFSVIGQGDGRHTIKMGTDTTFPSCSCGDWLQHRLPCQHFLAVFHHLGDEGAWEQLSPLYGRNPMFSLDLECIDQHVPSPDQSSRTPSRSLPNRTTSSPSELPSASKEGPVLRSTKNVTVERIPANGIAWVSTLLAFQALSSTGAVTADVSALQTPTDLTTSTQTSSATLTQTDIPASPANAHTTTSAADQPEHAQRTQIDEVNIEMTEDCPSVEMLQERCLTRLEELKQLSQTAEDPAILQGILEHLDSAWDRFQSGVS